MAINEIALLELLSDLIEKLEWATQEIQRLRGAVESAHPTREAYLAGAGVKEDDVQVGSIHELRKRIATIRRDLRR